MWSSFKTKSVCILMACSFVLVLAGCGNSASSSENIGKFSSQASSTIASTSQNLNAVTPKSSTFKVTGIDMSLTPSTTSTWTCGSYIQVVYKAVFHVDPGPKGGVISFYYTTNNGRGTEPAKLTILPGQHLSDYVFTWQEKLTSDHVYPGAGGILVTSPNNLISKLVKPAGGCK